MNSKIVQGVRVPEIGLGTFKLIGKTGQEAIRTALNIGYRHIDTAQVYNNEKMVGESIKQSYVERDQMFITSKIDRLNLEPRKLLTSVERTLMNLKMEYVDLLLIHWPNPDVDIRITLETMFSLKEQGRALHIGLSNFPMNQCIQIVEDIGMPIFCNQVEYHAMLGQFDLLDFAADHDVLITAYSPLAQGEILNNPLLLEIGNKYKKSAAQIALRWLIEQEQVVVIPKSATAKHLQENFDIYDFELEDEDFYAIDDLDKSMRVVNPNFAPNWN